MNASNVRQLRPTERVWTAKKYSGKTDEELVILCQAHDHEAYEEIIRRHQRTVFGLLYRLAPDWNDTSDLAQEVFIRMWRSIGKLRNPRAFKSWLNQIVTNLFYDELRKKPRQLPVVSMDEPIETDDGEMGTRDIRDKSAGPEEICARAELSGVVKNAMASLPEQFRTAIVLREFEGLSYDEIAMITSSEIGTVKSRIARARSKVQEIVAPYMKAA